MILLETTNDIVDLLWPQLSIGNVYTNQKNFTWLRAPSLDISSGIIARLRGTIPVSNLETHWKVTRILQLLVPKNNINCCELCWIFHGTWKTWNHVRTECFDLLFINLVCIVCSSCAWKYFKDARYDHAATTHSKVFWPFVFVLIQVQTMTANGRRIPLRITEGIDWPSCRPVAGCFRQAVVYKSKIGKMIKWLYFTMWRLQSVGRWMVQLGHYRLLQAKRKGQIGFSRNIFKTNCYRSTFKIYH